ncbi:hypothetical protein [Novipirellula artificiosorum]|uniref:Uncharacterized protein n=1 Tax=Novipirellula artificiosorum TaxID=2528016 RepID=A0A5C6DWH3_9BACT|nr:hypothetical protein [Novipirellula artificiosorum]TWU39406.1 hypothetical protein Poly41_22300 [Novipirellula artificiosorum]
MNRIIMTTGFFTVAFGWLSATVSAQHFGHDHSSYDYYGHGGYYGHSNHHGGHSHYNHGGYPVADYLTYPVHPPAYMYSAPAYTGPAYMHEPSSEYYCPDSGYCPQAAYGIGEQYAPLQSHGQPRDHAYGQSQSPNGPFHAGHDHSGHDHSNRSDAHASPSQPQDRSYVPAPSLNQAPRIQASPPRQPTGDAGTRQYLPDSQSSEPHRTEAPIQMDGPPPTF